MSDGGSSSEAAVEPGLSHERVGVFADALFAIAMTLLVVEIPRPPTALIQGDDDRMVMASRLWGFLTGNSGQFLAFVIAFLILWTAWRGHHRMFDQITRASSRILFLHVPLLIVVVLLPYSTGLIGDSVSNPLAICLFAAAVAALLLSEAALLWAVLADGVLRPGEDRRALRVRAFMLAATGLFWLLTAGLTWVMDGVPYLWLLNPLVGVVSQRLAGRGPRRPAR
ncbi:TMEM175 family protein [Nonomuraea sp. H19]|uniref:TMEM175 family protein n=1 Tax=Nonomuraea sp. H19 TaxID=3452206 RepID=UPI003F8C5347